MISFDLQYLQPETIEEALSVWSEASAEELSPRYLAGGTELVTMARDNRLRFGALIDLKRIPDQTSIREIEGRLVFGACVTLNQAEEDRRFPLLAAAASRVADHSVRNSITVGGNVCGMLPYREAVLPFLLCDGEALIASISTDDGRPLFRSEPLSGRFDKRLLLNTGEILVALSVPAQMAAAPHWYRRRERDSRIDYPLMTLCAVCVDGRLRIAVSGVMGYPFRSVDAESALSASTGTPRHRAEGFVAALPGELRDDMRASAEYRRELLIQAVADAIVGLGGEK